MKYFLLTFCLILFSTSSVLAKKRPCDARTYKVKDLIGKIIEFKDKVHLDTCLNRSLATMYMIGSVHESYLICGPWPSSPMKHLEWGHFMSQPRHKINKIIFWDGEIKNKEYLLKAKELLIKDYPEEKDCHDIDRFKLGWVYEKLGETEKAITLFEETFNEYSKKLNTFDCSMDQCGELMATVESLQFLKRIHEKKDDHKKVLELEKLIKEYEKKRVYSRWTK